jgi:dolichyl-phosphate beta-glucosyltransferase
MQKHFVVIPCFNEEKRLNLQVCQTFIDRHTDFNIVFVNDGSRDNTGEMLAEFCGSNSGRCILHNSTGNKGKGAAVRTGMVWCLGNTEAQMLAYIDADLSTPPDELVAMTGKLDKDDALSVVLGSRIRHLGAHVERGSLRHYSGRVFATAASLALNIPVYDTQCGAKVFRRNAAEIAFARDFVSPWLFDVEILFRLKRHYGPGNVEKYLCEYPLSRWTHVPGSKMKALAIFRAPFELLKIYQKYS